MILRRRRVELLRNRKKKFRLRTDLLRNRKKRLRRRIKSRRLRTLLIRYRNEIVRRRPCANHSQGGCESFPRGVRIIRRGVRIIRRGVRIIRKGGAIHSQGGAIRSQGGAIRSQGGANRSQGGANRSYRGWDSLPSTQNSALRTEAGVRPQPGPRLSPQQSVLLPPHPTRVARFCTTISPGKKFSAAAATEASTFFSLGRRKCRVPLSIVAWTGIV
jgi:hypothetical protein